MVTDRRGWQVHRRRTVHEGDGAERRLARWCSVQHDADGLRRRPLIEEPELHEKVVWMLTVVDRHALVRLTTLEQERIAAWRDGRGVQAQHRPRLETTTLQLVTRHEHAPIQGAKLRFTSRSALGVLLHE